MTTSRTHSRLSAFLLATGIGLVVLPVAVLLIASPAMPGSRASGGWHWPAGSTWLLARSILLALAVASCSLLIGLPAGLWWASGRHGRWALAPVGLHVLALCLPPYTVALGFARLAAGPHAGWFYGPVGLVLVLTTCLAPLVTLPVAASAARLDGDALEAAALCRPGGAVFFRVALPALLPAALLGALVVFVLSLGEVAVPQLLRLPTWAVTVFSRVADLGYAPAQAVQRCVPLLVVAAVVAFACQALDARALGTLGARPPERHVQWQPGWLLRAGGAAASAAALAALLSLSGIVAAGLWGEGGGSAALASSLPALGNSLLYALLASLLMVAVAVPAGFYWSRAGISATFSTLPLLFGLVMPGVVLSLGLANTWNRPATSWMYGGVAVPVLGLAGHYLYLALRAAKIGFDRLRRSWLDAGRIQGRTAWRRLTRIYLPLSARMLLAVALLGFLLGLRDTDTLIVVYPPGGQTLTIRALTLEANSPPGLAASAALLQLLATAAVLGPLVTFLKGRDERP